MLSRLVLKVAVRREVRTADGQSQQITSRYCRCGNIRRNSYAGGVEDKAEVRGVVGCGPKRRPLVFGSYEIGIRIEFEDCQGQRDALYALGDVDGDAGDRAGGGGGPGLEEVEGVGVANGGVLGSD